MLTVLDIIIYSNVQTESYVCIFRHTHVMTLSVRLMHLHIQTKLYTYTCKYTYPYIYTFMNLYLGNRSALASNFCVIIHCLEVSCKEDPITNLHATHQQKVNYSSNFQPLHWGNPANSWTVSHTFTCICIVFQAWKWRYTVSRHDW